MLRVGDTGDQVKVLQSIYRTMACRDPQALGEIVEMLGEWGDGYGVDGIFGDGTAEATRLIQRRMLRPETGVVDEAMWKYFGDLGYSQTNYTQHIDCLEPPVQPEPTPTPPTPPTPTPDRPPVETTGNTLRALVPNDSSESDREVSRWVDAVKEQVEEDVVDHWGFIEVRFGNDPQPGEAVVPIRNNTDVGGAGGYHYYDGIDPQGVVFLDSGQPDVVLSHEILEILADATTNHFAQRGGGDWWIHEICDPVQRRTYQRRGVNLSDFVTRQWFGENHAPGEDIPFNYYSHLGSVRQPYQIDTGGYQIVYTEGSGYEYIFAEGESPLALPLAANRIPCAQADLEHCADYITHRRVSRRIGTAQ